jgi:hypothetical protein
MWSRRLERHPRIVWRSSQHAVPERLHDDGFVAAREGLALHAFRSLSMRAARRRTADSSQVKRVFSRF